MDQKSDQLSPTLGSSGAGASAVSRSTSRAPTKPASRRQFNWRGPRAAQARWLASGASGQPRESGAPPGAGRPCKKKKRARNSHFSGPLWSQNAIFGALELQKLSTL